MKIGTTARLVVVRVMGSHRSAARHIDAVPSAPVMKARLVPTGHIDNRHPQFATNPPRCRSHWIPGLRLGRYHSIARPIP